MQIAMFPFASVLFKTLLSFLDNLWTNSGKFQFVTGTCDRNLTLTFNHETAEAHKRSLTAIETHWSRQWSHVVPPCKTIIYNYKKLMPLHADDSAEPITKPKISRPSCLLENNCRWCEWSYWAIVLKWKLSEFWTDAYVGNHLNRCQTGRLFDLKTYPGAKTEVKVSAPYKANVRILSPWEWLSVK